MKSGPGHLNTKKKGANCCFWYNVGCHYSVVGCQVTNLVLPTPLLDHRAREINVFRGLGTERHPVF